MASVIGPWADVLSDSAAGPWAAGVSESSTPKRTAVKKRSYVEALWPETPTPKRVKKQVYTKAVKLDSVNIPAVVNVDLTEGKNMLKACDRGMVLKRFKGEGRCTCKTGTLPCHRDLKFNDVYKFCMSWHGMPAVERWLILQAQYASSTSQGNKEEEIPATKCKWQMQGVPLPQP